MDRKKIKFFVVSISICLVIILICSFVMSGFNESSNDSLEDLLSTTSYNIESDIVYADKSNASDVFADNADVSEPIINEVVHHGWVINNIGYTYFYNDSAYEQFNFKNTALERYVNSVNNLSTIIADNTNLYNIIAPVSGSFASIPREVYVEDNFYNASQTTFVSTASSKFNDTVVNVPIIAQLEYRFDQGEYVFFRSDKNWTALGAYTAYVEFCKASNINYYNLSDFETSKQEDFLGCFFNAVSYDKSNENGVLFADIFSKSPDEVISYKPYKDVKTSLVVYDSGLVYDNYCLSDNSVGVSNAYDIFLGRDAERYEINTTSGGGNLLIIGDTSAYPMAVFLASHYSKIDIINPSKFKGNLKEFLSQRYYDDCICICYSTNAVNGEYIPNLNKIIGENNE